MFHSIAIYQNSVRVRDTDFLLEMPAIKVSASFSKAFYLCYLRRMEAGQPFNQFIDDYRSSSAELPEPSHVLANYRLFIKWYSKEFPSLFHFPGWMMSAFRNDMVWLRFTHTKLQHDRYKNCMEHHLRTLQYLGKLK